jgi:hypothetical protein
MRTLVLVAGLLLASSVAAQAESFLINNGLAPPTPSNVIDDARYLDDSVLVRNVGCGTPHFNSPCLEPGAPTEVELADGGDLFGLSAWDSSSVTLSGGHVFAANGTGTSSVTINGGIAEHVLTSDTSTVTINGGDEFYVSVIAEHSSTLIINGGWWKGVLADFYSTVTVNGGLVDHIMCDGDSTTVTVRGGTVGFLRPRVPSTTVTVSGGTVNSLEPINYSTVTVVGGSVLQAEPRASTIVVIGRGFAVDGSPVPYGAVAEDTGTLKGMLASGDLLDMEFDLGTGPSRGNIQLVEARAIPALSIWGYAALVSSLMGWGVVHRRRRR